MRVVRDRPWKLRLIVEPEGVGSLEIHSQQQEPTHDKFRSDQNNAPARSRYLDRESHDRELHGAPSRDQPAIQHDALPRPCGTALQCVQSIPPTTRKGR